MKQFYEMGINELCKLAHEQQVEIEVRIEPTEYGRINSTFTIQPWEKYEPSQCPYGQPIVYVKEKHELNEPKTGHWIESAGNDKCSVCGATYSDLYPDYDQTHYCPNCGAKMIVKAGE